MKYKVLKYITNQGEDFAYTIVEPTEYSGTHPLMHFGHMPYAVQIHGYSIEELKTKLRKMLEACDSSEILRLEPEKFVTTKRPT